MLIALRVGLISHGFDVGWQPRRLVWNVDECSLKGDEHERRVIGILSECDPGAIRALIEVTHRPPEIQFDVARQTAAQHGGLQKALQLFVNNGAGHFYIPPHFARILREKGMQLVNRLTLAAARAREQMAEALAPAE